ncbi:MAG: hypothetical protein ACJA0X_001460 [Cyclobacteriaceae bacterium]|jgi:hypothetical protein
MIVHAKLSYSRGGFFYFLLWGWVIMLANLSHYLLATFSEVAHPEIVWLVTIPAGITSGIYGSRRKKDAGAVSHIDKMYGDIWTAAGVGIIFTLVFMRQLNGYHGAVILLSAGIGTFLSGQIMRFKPLIIGGIALWVTCIISMFLGEVDQLLVAVGGIIAGYLIPGYLLKRSEK